MMMSSDFADTMINAEGESIDVDCASFRCETSKPSICPEQSSSSIPVRPSSNRRSISRVVVLHNEKVSSFSNPSLIDNNDVPADFFDTPEFWSGSITWW